MRVAHVDVKDEARRDEAECFAVALLGFDATERGRILQRPEELLHAERLGVLDERLLDRPRSLAGVVHLRAGERDPAGGSLEPDPRDGVLVVGLEQVVRASLGFARRHLLARGEHEDHEPEGHADQDRVHDLMTTKRGRHEFPPV